MNVCFVSESVTVISPPDDVTVCAGDRATFTCVLDVTDADIKDDVQWYRFIRGTGTTEMVDPDGGDITILTRTNGNTTTSTLTVTNGRKSDTGSFWVEIQSLTYCNASLTVATSTYVCEQTLCMYVFTYVYIHTSL